ncbi:MAG: PEGA domain-containing protein [Deltaproteobacteria bacterium]|nr:MAG: PEGA domain-containing protein [Deltaproteobacteria bacterium]
MRANPQASSRRFGKYELVRRIATGGMAEIYRARYIGAAGITKQVVLKKILPTYADNRRFVQMFIDEAKITVGLTHGNIAQVFDFGEVDGEYFLAMEFVHGQSLSRIEKRAGEMDLRIPIPIACFIVMEMCKGLHYAHRKTDDAGNPLGIVHRDVSPQNVMVSYEGQVKLVDFGIAKAATVAQDTEAGALKGKYLYFAPEQARGRELDARADIFATGIVLYELLTGRRPFEGSLIEVLSAIASGDFAPPSAVNEEIPPSLERIVLKAMARRRADRYQSALDLQEALATFLYSAAPRFTSANLGHYVQYLFHEDLLAEGLSVELPAEFLEQLPLWQKQPVLPGVQGSDAEGDEARTDPGLPPDAEAPVSGETAPTRPLGPGATAQDTDYEALRAMGAPERQAPTLPVRPEAGRRPWLRYLAYGMLPLVVLAIAVGAVYSATQAVTPNESTGTVAIESDPPGAEIEIDGVATGRKTPAVFTGLQPNRSYGLTLRLPGHRPLMKTFSPRPTGSTVIRERLIPEDLSIARPELAATEAELRKQLRKAAREEAIIRPKGLAASLEQMSEEMGAIDPNSDAPIEVPLRLQRAVLDVRRLGARSVALDPSVPHELSVVGEAFLGPRVFSAPVTALLYAAARPKQPREGDVGLLSVDKPVSLEAGATRLWLILPDFAPRDNEGALVVRIEAPGGARKEVEIRPAKHAFSVERRGIPVTERVHQRKYRVEIQGGPLPPNVALFYLRKPTIKVPTEIVAAEPDFGLLRPGAIVTGASQMAVFGLAPTRPPKGRRVVRFEPH